ncbi:hypothetical protein CRM22_003608 [Opisthorchis felineus]|uniref:Uncharacterized protein n=1 Tax=Opisthorchis felineus TaxID=147828 RepID=A0A4S2M0C8_OPIFE|nr:hypothetical protein CRM22_003608 [Opisthorchis felineus]
MVSADLLCVGKPAAIRGLISMFKLFYFLHLSRDRAYASAIVGQVTLKSAFNTDTHDPTDHSPSVTHGNSFPVDSKTYNNKKYENECQLIQTTHISDQQLPCQQLVSSPSIILHEGSPMVKNHRNKGTNIYNSRMPHASIRLR